MGWFVCFFLVNTYSYSEDCWLRYQDFWIVSKGKGMTNWAKRTVMKYNKMAIFIMWNKIVMLCIKLLNCTITSYVNMYCPENSLTTDKLCQQSHMYIECITLRSLVPLPTTFQTWSYRHVQHFKLYKLHRSLSHYHFQFKPTTITVTHMDL